MKIIKTFTISIFFLTCLMFKTNSAFSQESKSFLENLNKNAIYGEVGMGALNADASYFYTALHYERMLQPKIWNKNISSFLRIGLGQIYAESNRTYNFTKVQYELLIGARTHHLELIAGLNYYFNFKKIYRNRPKPLQLSSTVGWRIQKPGKRFLFRTGVGWPDGFYFGFGWSF